MLQITPGVPLFGMAWRHGATSSLEPKNCTGVGLSWVDEKLKEGSVPSHSHQLHG